MKINNVAIILFVSALWTGCFAPINSTFEGAKLLDKGEVELQGNYSRYYFPFEDEFGGNTNNNVGVAIGYGVSEKFNMKLRYERMHVITQDWDFFDLDGGDFGMNYLELGNKFLLREDKIAFSMPMAIYFTNFNNSPLFSLDPRFLFTIGGTEKFEFNIIPKAHVFIGDGVAILPGFNLGFAFSNDLNKWAIRPEIGYDTYFTIGIGMNYYFKPGAGK